MKYIKMWLDENGNMQKEEHDDAEKEALLKGKREEQEKILSHTELDVSVDEEKQKKIKEENAKREEERRAALEKEGWVFCYTKEELEKDVASMSLDEESKEHILMKMGRLKDRERAMIAMRIGWFGETRTLEEVAVAFGVTRERIRQIESKFFRSHIHCIRSKKMREFLE